MFVKSLIWTLTPQVSVELQVERLPALIDACLVTIVAIRADGHGRAGEVFADGPKERSAVSEPRHQTYLVDGKPCLAKKMLCVLYLLEAYCDEY